MERSGTRSGSDIFTNPHEVASFRPSLAPATQRFDLISIYSSLISENNPQAPLVLLGHTTKSYYITTLNQNTLSIFQCPVREFPSLPQNKLPSESKCPHCLYFMPIGVIHHPTPIHRIRVVLRMGNFYWKFHSNAYDSVSQSFLTFLQLSQGKENGNIVSVGIILKTFLSKNEYGWSLDDITRILGNPQ